MEAWLGLLFLWVAWKVFGSVFEQLQNRRREEQKKSEAEKPAQRVPARRSPPAARPAGHTGQEMPSPPSSAGREQNELERLLREAMARKRQPGLPPAPPPLPQKEHARPDTERSRATQPVPSAARIEAPPPPIETRRVEASPSPRESYQVERRRVVHKRKTAPVRQAVPLQERAAQQPRVARVKRQARISPMRRPSSACSGIGPLNLTELRRGIILSEILKAPKGLGEIDSRLV